MIIWLALAAHAACPEGRVTRIDVSAAVAQALEVRADPPLLRERAAAARELVGCASELLLPEVVAQVHALYAAEALVDGDRDRAEDSARAAVALGGAVEGLAVEPVEPIYIPVEGREGASVYVDGRRSFDRPVDRAALVQVEREEGSIALTAYVHAGELLPLRVREPTSPGAGFDVVAIRGGVPFEPTPCPGERTTREAVRTALDGARLAEAEGLAAAAEAARVALICVEGPLSTADAAAWWRIAGRLAVARGDETAAVRALQAAAVLQPARELTAPPGSDLERLWTLARSRSAPAMVPFEAPPRVEVLVDGVRGTFRPGHLPVILQLEEAGEVVETWLVPPGSQLPPRFPSNVEFLLADAPAADDDDFEESGVSLELRGGYALGELRHTWEETLASGSVERSEEALNFSHGPAVSLGVLFAAAPETEIGLFGGLVPGEYAHIVNDGVPTEDVTRQIVWTVDIIGRYNLRIGDQLWLLPQFGVAGRFFRGHTVDDDRRTPLRFATGVVGGIGARAGSRWALVGEVLLSITGDDGIPAERTGELRSALYYVRAHVGIQRRF